MNRRVRACVWCGVCVHAVCMCRGHVCVCACVSVCMCERMHAQCHLECSNPGEGIQGHLLESQFPAPLPWSKMLGSKVPAEPRFSSSCVRACGPQPVL